jgi:hypothetical protein
MQKRLHELRRWPFLLGDWLKQLLDVCVGPIRFVYWSGHLHFLRGRHVLELRFGDDNIFDSHDLPDVPRGLLCGHDWGLRMFMLCGCLLPINRRKHFMQYMRSWAVFHRLQQRLLQLVRRDV